MINLDKKRTSSLAHDFVYHFWTLFLFSKPDFKNTIIPVTLFAASNSPGPAVSRLIPTVFWIYTHLLEFELANQTLNPAEDAYNKPFRPIPAGRCSYRTACTLRWTMLALCTIWSAYCSIEVLAASVFCNVVTYVYDDMGVDRGHWIVRNLFIALGYLTFQLGACVVMCDNRTITPDALLSIICSMGIFITTSHAQDFKDVVGDELVGRSSFPLAYPTASRLAMFTTVPWSVALSLLWGSSAPFTIIFTLVGLAVAVRFWEKREIKADQRSYYLYCVWFTMAFCLPASSYLTPKVVQ